MAKIEKVEIDLHEDSIDSDDREFLDLVEEPAYGSVTSETPQLVTHTYLEGNEDEDSSSYNFRDLSGSVAYKIVQMDEEEPTNNMNSESPTHLIPSGEFYIINNPVEVFSSDSQKKPIKRQPLQAKAATAKKRDDKRRATHNEVERRRRDKINSWITKIADMIPNCGQADTASKGGILAKACDHIADLTMKTKKLEQVEKENAKLVLEVLRLNKELSELRKENSSMRIQLADNCIVANLQRAKGQKS
ncbi:upstream stimulatory factor 2 isoform X1 [Pieris rapae]|uniref:upstream stimulatory factor 2 isoform X1 n=1 Tax=Pieris rapae TaxID=64459 RepID=UPI000B9271CB|nr:upstream stimulatory factor 2 isoform X1 [Pieris rapae]